MSDNFFIEIISFYFIALYITALNLFLSFVSEKIGNDIYIVISHFQFYKIAKRYRI